MYITLLIFINSKVYISYTPNQYVAYNNLIKWILKY